MRRARILLAILAFVLAVASVAGMAACGGAERAPAVAAPDTSQPAPEPPEALPSTDDLKPSELPGENG